MELRRRREEMTQMVNLTHTEHGHYGLVLVVGGPDERILALRSAQPSHIHSSDPVTSVRRPALVTALTSPL